MLWHPESLTRYLTAEDIERARVVATEAALVSAMPREQSVLPPTANAPRYGDEHRTIDTVKDVMDEEVGDDMVSESVSRGDAHTFDVFIKIQKGRSLPLLQCCAAAHGLFADGASACRQAKWIVRSGCLNEAGEARSRHKCVCARRSSRRWRSRLRCCELSCEAETRLRSRRKHGNWSQSWQERVVSSSRVHYARR